MNNVKISRNYPPYYPTPGNSHTRLIFLRNGWYYKIKHNQWSHTKGLKHNSSLLLLAIVIVINSTKWRKHNSTMIIVYLEMSFTTNWLHVETSQLVCFANHLIGFYMIWSFNKIYFWTEHNSTKMNLISMTYFSIIYLILLKDEI